jgi:ATP-dependent protease ClpP protease subunit
MAEKMIFDRRTGTWLRVAQNGAVYRADARPAEKTQASIWLFGPIERAAEGRGRTDLDFLADLAAIPAVDELHLFIDSGGGSVTAMTTIADAFNRHPAKTKITHGLGRMFSAAGFLFLLGDKRTMTPDASLMLHNVVRSGDPTPADCIELSALICSAYAERATSTDFATIREWQHRETYVNTAQAIRLGFATNLDLDNQGRVGIDASRSHQPDPVTDFWATRQFNARVQAAKTVRKAQATPVVANPIVATPSTRFQAVWPEMPAKLRGHAFSSMADFRLNQPARNEPLNPFQKHEEARMIRMLARLRSAGGN